MNNIANLRKRVFNIGDYNVTLQEGLLREDDTQAKKIVFHVKHTGKTAGTLSQGVADGVLHTISNDFAFISNDALSGERGYTIILQTNAKHAAKPLLTFDNFCDTLQKLHSSIREPHHLESFVNQRSASHARKPASFVERTAGSQADDITLTAVRKLVKGFPNNQQAGLLEAIAQDEAALRERFAQKPPSKSPFT